MNLVSGQSAIEYLMTYGWMLLVVAVVGGAVFSVVGDQNIETVTGFESSDINFQDFGVSETGMSFVMKDPIGQSEIKKVNVSNPSSGNVTYTLNQELSGDKIVHLPGISPSGRSTDLEVDIIYDSGNLENLVTTGHVGGTFALEEEFHDREIILNGLVGYWPLLEEYGGDVDGQQAKDFSGGRNDAVAENGVNTEVEGVFGNAFEFDGESTQVYIDRGLSDIIEGSNSYTFSAWINMGRWVDEQNVGGRAIILGQEGGSAWDRTGGLAITTDRDVRFRVAHSSDEEENDVSYYTASTSYEPWGLNTWTHITGVWDQDTESDHKIMLFVNGNLIEEENGLTEKTSDRQIDELMIGSRRSSSGGEFDGIIDDVRVYDHALSKEEVETIYEQGDIE